MTNNRVRMSEERLEELSRLVSAELTVPSRLVRVALDEIDELKAEVRESRCDYHEQILAGLHAEVREGDERKVHLNVPGVGPIAGLKRKIQDLEAEVARLQRAIRKAYLVPSCEETMAVLRDALRAEEEKP